MNKEIQQQAIDMIHSLGSGIATLGDKIGVGAAHMWPVMVRQQYIEGLTGLMACGVAFLIFLALIGVCIWAAIKLTKTNNEMYIIVAGPCGMISFFILLFLFLNTTDYVRHMLNPEYYAAIDLIERIK